MTLVTPLAMRRISERMAARREGIPRPPIVLDFVQTQLFCMQTQPKRKINGVMPWREFDQQEVDLELLTHPS